MGFGRVLGDFSERAHSLMNALGGASPGTAIGGTPSFHFGQQAVRAQVDSGAVEHMIGQRAMPDNPFTTTLAQIEVNPKVNKTDNIEIKLRLPKPPAQMSKADYDKAYLKELFHRAGHPNVTDGELAAFQSAVIKYTGAPFGLAADLTTLRDVHARTGRIKTTTSEWRQAVVDAGAREIYRQRDEWTAAVDAAQAKSREYGTAALKGWAALHVNAPINLINGLTEPVRGVAAMGGAYIPSVPRWEAMEKSEYWQAGNKGQAAELAGTITAGALAGGASVLATTPGKVIATLEATYNIGVGAAGVDPTQGNRAMSPLERTVRVVGGAVTAAGVSRGLGGTTSAGTAMEAEAVTAEGVRVRVPLKSSPLESINDPKMVKMNGNVPSEPLNLPANRHYVNKVTEKSWTKAENTVIEPWVDVKADVEAINAGRAARTGNHFEINGRTYGVEPNGTLYPISGRGFHLLDRKAYNALKLYKKFGNTPRVAEILDNMGVSAAQRESALKAWRAEGGK